MEATHGHTSEELLIWVDENDREIGYGEKIETHRIGQLHRAFSVFVYDPELRRLLLQKRARGKYHSGGLWSNSCCSHPRKGEIFCSAVSRCLWEELRIEHDFQEIKTQKPLAWTLTNSRDYLFCAGRFQYYAGFGDLSEHEMDHVLLFCQNSMEGPILFNQDEAEEVKWVCLDELDVWLEENPAAFSAWFAQAYQLFQTFIERVPGEMGQKISG